MEIRSVKIKEIKPYDRNAKKHDDTQINNVAESIRQFGFVQPIVIDSDGVIVIGHCRFEAAKRLKYAEVPCIMVDDLTPEQVDTSGRPTESRQRFWNLTALPRTKNILQ